MLKKSPLAEQTDPTVADIMKSHKKKEGKENSECKTEECYTSELTVMSSNVTTVAKCV